MRFEKFLRVCQEWEIVFEEGSSGNKMYVIHSGKVRLSVSKDGRDLLLAVLGPGDFFGEMALVDDAPRCATATAEEEGTRLLAFDRRKFIYLVSQQPAFALTVMHVLCQRIRELDSGLVQAIHKEEVATSAGTPEVS